MIRLSELTALDILDEKTTDLNIEKLHVYELPFNGQINTQIIMDDIYTSKPNTRKYSMCTFMNNVLLGTPNFYPTQGLGISGYHENSTLQNLMSITTVPFLEFKKARLYFSQGYLNNPNNIGHWFRIYIKKSDGSTLTLASFFDMNDASSNIVASAPKYFETNVYNECIEFEFLDIDFLLNSTIDEVNDIKEFLLGDERPFTYHIEYAPFTELGLDNFIENGYEFSKISFTQINEQSLTIGDSSDGLLSFIKIDDSGHFLNSRLYHNKFDITTYMNGLKKDNEIYEVQHIFNIESYKNQNLVASDVVVMLRNDFENVKFSPIIPLDVEYARVNKTIRVRNINTSMVFRRETSILIPTEIIGNFKPQSNITLNLTSNEVNKTVHRNVQKIVASSETPKIVQIEKKIYLQMQPLEEITLLDGVFVVELTLPNEINGYSKLFLKIGSILIENEISGKPIFEIESNAYSEQTSRYLLLDENMKTISSGKLNKV